MAFKNYKADTCIPLKEAWDRGELNLNSLVRLDYPGRPMPSKMLKGVNSIGFWDAHMPQKWGLDWHRNEGIEITFLETGSMNFSTEQNLDTVLMANQLTIMRPWQLHKLGNPNIGIGKLHWIILDVHVRNPHQSWEWPDWIVLSKSDLNELTKILRQSEKVIWQSDQKIRSCFNEIAKVIIRENFLANESELIIQINTLLLSILNLFRNGDISLDKTLMESKRTVRLFLDELPSHVDKPWTLESMSEECNLGTTRFVHFCKKITNMTPMEYLNYHRIMKSAKILTSNMEINIQDVAFDCGFTSSQYFATQFKKQYGLSPSQFKKSKESAYMN